MRIAFTSTSSQGKTTLVKEMIKWDIFKNYTTFSSVQRVLTDCISDFSTSELTTDFTQTCILSVMAYNMHQYPNQISDRSLICNFAYSKVSDNVLNHKFLEERFEKIIEMYDLIFYIPYEIEVQNDNFRSTDGSFHKKIDDAIQEYIEKYKHKIKIVTISGSIEDRLEKIYKVIKEINDTYKR